MTVEADPHLLVLLPVGLEKRVLIGVSVNARLPFLVNFAVTFPAGFSAQARGVHREFSETEWHGHSLNGAQK